MATLAERIDTLPSDIEITPLQPIIDAALVKHKVVFCRDQALDNDSLAFARQFGAPYTHPSPSRDRKIASIHHVAAENIRKADKDPRDHAKRGNLYYSGTSWR